MSRQLSCRGMCKIVTWNDHYSSFNNKIYLFKTWIMRSLSIHEMDLRQQAPLPVSISTWTTDTLLYILKDASFCQTIDFRHVNILIFLYFLLNKSFQEGQKKWSCWSLKCQISCAEMEMSSSQIPTGCTRSCFWYHWTFWVMPPHQQNVNPNK